jgi:hypothetical protein
MGALLILLLHGGKRLFSPPGNVLHGAGEVKTAFFPDTRQSIQSPS